MFPIVDSNPKDILIALKENSGVFIKDPTLVRLGKSTFEVSKKLIKQNDLPALDEYTMFPKSVGTLPNVSRSVIQRYVTRSFELDNEEVSDLMAQLSGYCEILSQEILSEGIEFFNWDEKLIDSLFVKDEWVLNIANYPFMAGHKDQLLFPAHKDWGLMAIYPYVDGTGLEAIVNKEWKPVILPDDCAFCYCGDIFTRVTNGEVSALSHRVIQTSDVGERTSIIFYVDPIRSLQVSNQTVGDIIDSKLKKIGQIQ